VGGCSTQLCIVHCHVLVWKCVWMKVTREMNRNLRVYTANLDRRKNLHLCSAEEYLKITDIIFGLIFISQLSQVTS